LIGIDECRRARYRRRRRLGVGAALNNGLNAGIIMPRAIVPPRASQREILKVFIDGTCIDEGNLWSIPGGAEDSVKWLTNNLSEHVLKLLSEVILLTGTSSGLHPVKPGDHIRVTADGDQCAECRIR
jgi:2-keto-4-pentenoate hydratase